MRLTKPTLFTNLPVTCEDRDLPGELERKQNYFFCFPDVFFFFTSTFLYGLLMLCFALFKQCCTQILPVLFAVVTSASLRLNVVDLSHSRQN